MKRDEFVLIMIWVLLNRNQQWLAEEDTLNNYIKDYSKNIIDHNLDIKKVLEVRNGKS